ncbi:DUF4857 domain-containing protein [Bacteroides ihuae]|uniref:DUF4857 domain-containing protein n=1 Tax=Bacteroides ihuae TaxID=1852362 RepID=UPI0008DAA895|nr:DUF4857 domain-containing protein [Bacteroides ihuae]
MKQKSKIYTLILLLVTAMGFYTIPALVKMMTEDADDYPFVYYSSILKDFCFVEYQNTDALMHDRAGNVYTQTQFDSLLPLLNYRQLILDGRLPDSINGHEVSAPILQAKNVVYRYSPDKIYTPESGLYIMYESAPKRINGDTPTDVFRFTDRIEFIDIKSNKVKSEKSYSFQQAIDKAGYAFPPQWISGNMNPMKPYDQGYFSLDAKGELYHIKMVNGHPFVRNTHIGEKMKIERFVMVEMADKRFSGFLFDQQGFVYIIEADKEKYKPLKLDIDTIDIKHDEMLVMGNLLYWTVTVTRQDKQSYYALETGPLKRVAAHEVIGSIGKWEIASKWLFPVYLDFESNTTKYIAPVARFTGYYVFFLNLILALLVAFFIPNTKSKRAFYSTYVLLTGIVGLIALSILPDFIKKKANKS